MVDNIAADERRLLAVLGCGRESGMAMAGPMVPGPLDEDLVRSLARLADVLE